MQYVYITLPADHLDLQKLEQVFEVNDYFSESFRKNLPFVGHPESKTMPKSASFPGFLEVTLHLVKGTFRSGAGCSVYVTVSFLAKTTEDFCVDSIQDTVNTWAVSMLPLEEKQSFPYIQGVRRFPLGITVL